jgi:hypothetical protein
MTVKPLNAKSVEKVAESLILATEFVKLQKAVDEAKADVTAKQQAVTDANEGTKGAAQAALTTAQATLTTAEKNLKESYTIDTGATKTAITGAIEGHVTNLTTASAGIDAVKQTLTTKSSATLTEQIAAIAKACDCAGATSLADVAALNIALQKQGIEFVATTESPAKIDLANIKINGEELKVGELATSIKSLEGLKKNVDNITPVAQKMEADQTPGDKNSKGTKEKTEEDKKAEAEAEVKKAADALYKLLEEPGKDGETADKKAEREKKNTALQTTIKALVESKNEKDFITNAEKLGGDATQKEAFKYMAEKAVYEAKKEFGSLGQKAWAHTVSRFYYFVQELILTYKNKDVKTEIERLSKAPEAPAQTPAAPTAPATQTPAQAPAAATQATQATATTAPAPAQGATQTPAPAQGATQTPAPAQKSVKDTFSEAANKLVQKGKSK